MSGLFPSAKSEKATSMFMKRVRLLSALLMLLALTGCSGIRLKPEAKNVRLYFDAVPGKECTFLGEAVGTEGNIFTFLFIPNDVLMQSAINDIKNEAEAKGADSVYLMRNQLNFSSSVTLLGQMYRCR